MWWSLGCGVGTTTAPDPSPGPPKSAAETGDSGAALCAFLLDHLALPPCDAAQADNFPLGGSSRAACCSACEERCCDAVPDCPPEAHRLSYAFCYESTLPSDPYGPDPFRVDGVGTVVAVGGWPAVPPGSARPRHYGSCAG